MEQETDYAKYILKKYNYSTPPIEPYKIAELLGVTIIFSKNRLEHEGVLFKSGEKPYILLSPLEPAHEQRVKFTIAMLLGHLVIPWHLKNVFYRKSDIHSLEIEDQLSIEAREFAGTLILPPSILRKDLKILKPSLENFEEIAYNKLAALC